MGKAVGDASGEMHQQGGVHAGMVALRRGVALVQAPDQPAVEGKRRYGKRPDEILPVEVAADGKRVSDSR